MISATAEIGGAPKKNGRIRVTKETDRRTSLKLGGVEVMLIKMLRPQSHDYSAVERKRESVADEGKARERAEAVRESLAAGEVEAAAMRLEDVRCYENALALLEPVGVTLESACREYAQAFAALKGRASILQAVQEYAKRFDVSAEKTVQEVVTELLQAKGEGRATKVGGKGTIICDRYKYQMGLRLQKFAEKVPGLINEVESDDVNEFVLGLKKKDGTALRGRTRNNYVESVSVLFEYARKRQYIQRDSTLLEELEEWSEEDYDIDIFSAEEIKKLLAAAPEALRPVLMIGAFAGLRTAEIARLDWSEVNLETRLIEVKARKAKTRARRLVPISENLAALLKDVHQTTGPVWGKSVVYLHELQGVAAANAGLKWKHNGLRHSFISYCVADVKNVQQVALESGNSPEVIFQHYRELVTEKQAGEWFGVTPAAVEAVRKEQEAERQAKVVTMQTGELAGSRANVAAV